MFSPDAATVMSAVPEGPSASRRCVTSTPWDARSQRRRWPEGSAAERADKDDGGSRVCGGGRLVRALAAEAVGERGARECFAGGGETVDRDRDILVDGTDDNDACHERSFAMGCSIVPRHRGVVAYFGASSVELVVRALNDAES